MRRAPVLGEPRNGNTGARVPEVRYDHSAATLPPEIRTTVLCFPDPRTPRGAGSDQESKM